EIWLLVRAQLPLGPLRAVPAPRGLGSDGRAGAARQPVGGGRSEQDGVGRRDAVRTDRPLPGGHHGAARLPVRHPVPAHRGRPRVRRLPVPDTARL
ncbi:MAG: hypothetical protein AVDCRST_MAG10-1268, partial [uncultured Acidimicrobiales bacterium]